MMALILLGMATFTFTACGVKTPPLPPPSLTPQQTDEKLRYQAYFDETAGKEEKKKTRKKR